MTAGPEPDAERWLARARRLRAIAQTGLAYSGDDYDLERFREIQRIAEDMLAAVGDLPPARVRGLFAPERGYPTPKLDLRAGVLVEQEGLVRVLLVREAADGRWSLPGGWADEQETPRQGIEREVLEESGYRVRAERLVAIKDRALHPYLPRRLEHIYKLYFLCEFEGGRARASMETTEVGFFRLDALPPLSVGRTLAADIEMLDRYRRQPSLPALFD